MEFLLATGTKRFPGRHGRHLFLLCPVSRVRCLSNKDVCQSMDETADYFNPQLL